LHEADRALRRGETKEALRLAEQACKEAEVVEKQVESESLRQAQMVREAGDHLARAGSLWVALTSQKRLNQWLKHHEGVSMLNAEEKLRQARQAYAQGRFSQAIQISRQLEAELTSLIEHAGNAIAEEQRDSYARDAEETLRHLGFETRTELENRRRIVYALQKGRVMMTLRFDDQGRFEVDSRHGYRGIACAVEVNKFLQAFGEKVSFEVENRRYFGKPDESPGRTQHVGISRRRLTIKDIMEKAVNQAAAGGVPPQAVVAAWSRITR